MAGLTSQFTDDQIDEFKEAFNLFDKNQDGTIYESQVRKCNVHTKKHNFFPFSNILS